MNLCKNQTSCTGNELVDDGFSKPREHCGIFGIYGHPEAARLTFFGLYALQHRGQESCGIVAGDGYRVSQHRGMGLVSEVFDSRGKEALPGHLAIGHVRYSTTGSTNIINAQPFVVQHGGQTIAIAHNGTLTNARQIRCRLEDRGSIFQSTMDTEVIVHLMARHRQDIIDLIDALAAALAEVQGSYSLVLATEDMVIAARDPRGFRPLCLGQLNGSWVVASETCALDLVQADYFGKWNPAKSWSWTPSAFIPASPSRPGRPSIASSSSFTSPGRTAWSSAKASTRCASAWARPWPGSTPSRATW